MQFVTQPSKAWINQSEEAKRFVLEHSGETAVTRLPIQEIVCVAPLMCSNRCLPSISPIQFVPRRENLKGFSFQLMRLVGP